MSVIRSSILAGLLLAGCASEPLKDEGFQINGRVIDDQTGQAIAGARVTRGLTFTPNRDFPGRGSILTMSEVIADDEGRFTFVQYRLPTTLSIVEAPDGTPVCGQVDVQSVPTEEIVIRAGHC